MKPLPGRERSRYALRDSTVPEPPVTWRAGYTTLALSLLIIEQLANVLAAVGALLMVLRRRDAAPRPADRPGRAGRPRCCSP